MEPREATLKDAARDDCCANDAWRGHFCTYHEGYEAGYEAAGQDNDSYPENETK